MGPSKVILINKNVTQAQPDPSFRFLTTGCCVAWRLSAGSPSPEATHPTPQTLDQNHELEKRLCFNDNSLCCYAFSHRQWNSISGSYYSTSPSPMSLYVFWEIKSVLIIFYWVKHLFTSESSMDIVWSILFQWTEIILMDFYL